MGKFFDEIPDFVIDFIRKQQVFWVATAPLSSEGHINLSSKGLEGTFHVIDASTVWYEDLTGSGVETISHLRENGRITVFFNAFEGPPRIVRLFGKGTVHEFGSEEYNSFLTPETRLPGSRAVIKIDVHKVGTSCGYSVPFFQFVGHRTKLLQFTSKRERIDIEAAETEGMPLDTVKKGGLKDYWVEENLKSIDNLPGMEGAHKSLVQFRRPPEYKADNERVSKSRPGLKSIVDLRFVMGLLVGVVLTASFQGFYSRLSTLLPL